MGNIRHSPNAAIAAKPRFKANRFARSGHVLRGAAAPFDADMWMALVEEQKLAIARAAGVDPSKVRIQIGH